MRRARSAEAAGYCWILGQLGGRAAERALLCVLQGPRRSLWMQAGVSLAMAGSVRVAGALTAVAGANTAPRRREAAAYALGRIGLGPEARGAAEAMLSIVGNGRNSPSLRGVATESLANILGARRRAMPWARLVRAAEATLLERLSDPSAEARFWSAYGLGVLRSQAAVPALRRLARRDRTVVPGWWQVAQEARDALRCIAGGVPRARIGRRV